MRIARALLSILLIAFLTSPAHAQDLQIGVVLAGTRGLFWTAMEKGIQQASKDFDVGVMMRSPTDDDPATIEQNLQLKMAQYMLQAGVKALILAPMPVTNVPTPIDLHVPVVFVDRPSDVFNTLSTISTDNYAAGRAAALTLQGRLSKGAKVAVLRLAPYVVSTTAREAGFIDMAKELGFEIVVDTYLTHGIREAEAVAAEVLDPYRGRIDTVFTPSGKLTQSTLRALQDWPRDKRPLLVGFDYEPNFEQEIRNGDLYAIVVQDAFQMGYQAVQQLVRVQSKQQIPAEIRVDFIAVTRGNVDDPKIQASLGQYRD